MEETEECLATILVKEAKELKRLDEELGAIKRVLERLTEDALTQSEYVKQIRADLLRQAISDIDASIKAEVTAEEE